MGEGDPWNGVKKTHEGLTVSDSPVSEDGTSRVPPEPQAEEKTEDGTEKKEDRTVIGETGAGSSQDPKTEDPKTKTRDVREETETDNQTIHTPGPRP